LLLDSGAYGAWTRGIELDLDEYCTFIKRNKRALGAYVNVDVIPGTKEHATRSREALEKSARASYQNFNRMRDKGLSPIPVFHQGEDWKWLLKMIDERVPYIGISPYAKARAKSIKEWLDQVFCIITDKEGDPVVKTHGFGVLSPRTICRYPWYTVDGTSWALDSGQIMIPSQYDWRQIRQVHVTGLRPEAGNQFGNKGDLERAHIEHYLRSIGLSIKLVSSSLIARYQANITLLKSLQTKRGDVRFARPPGHYLGLPRIDPSLVGQTFPFRIAFATQMQVHNKSEALNRCEISKRLVSYFDLIEREESDLHYYVKHGALMRQRKPLKSAAARIAAARENVR
jgi:hypothetical protein